MKKFLVLLGFKFYQAHKSRQADKKKLPPHPITEKSSVPTI